LASCTNRPCSEELLPFPDSKMVPWMRSGRGADPRFRSTRLYENWCCSRGRGSDDLSLRLSTRYCRLGFEGSSSSLANWRSWSSANSMASWTVSNCRNRLRTSAVTSLPVSLGRAKPLLIFLRMDRRMYGRWHSAKHAIVYETLGLCIILK
jgi:hypothetical protein